MRQEVEHGIIGIFGNCEERSWHWCLVPARNAQALLDGSFKSVPTAIRLTPHRAPSRIRANASRAGTPWPALPDSRTTANTIRNPVRSEHLDTNASRALEQRLFQRDTKPRRNPGDLLAQKTPSRQSDREEGRVFSSFWALRAPRGRLSGKPPIFCEHKTL